MAQAGNPENTFRTHNGVPSGAFNMMAALNASAWQAWNPIYGDFPYQAGSGYGDLNDNIIAAPPGQYDTYNSLHQTGSNTSKVANKTAGKPDWLTNLTYWWKGRN